MSEPLVHLSNDGKVVGGPDLAVDILELPIHGLIAVVELDFVLSLELEVLSKVV